MKKTTTPDGLPASQAADPILIKPWADRLDESLSALLDGCQTEADIRHVLEAMETDEGSKSIRLGLAGFLATERLFRSGHRAATENSEIDVSAAVLSRIRAEKLSGRGHAVPMELSVAGGVLAFLRPRAYSMAAGIATAVLAVGALSWHASTSPEARLAAELQDMQKELHQVLSDHSGRRQSTENPAAVSAVASSEASAPDALPPSGPVINPLIQGQVLWPQQPVSGVEEVPASQKR